MNRNLAPHVFFSNCETLAKHVSYSALNASTTDGAEYYRNVWGSPLHQRRRPYLAPYSRGCVTLPCPSLAPRASPTTPPSPTPKTRTPLPSAPAVLNALRQDLVQGEKHLLWDEGTFRHQASASLFHYILVLRIQRLGNSRRCSLSVGSPSDISVALPPLDIAQLLYLSAPSLSLHPNFIQRLYQGRLARQRCRSRHIQDLKCQAVQVCTFEIIRNVDNRSLGVRV